ncbi:MAG: hypothetical protein D6762_07300 [Candidatus Neomarinimicrobiota bacterium]|nr:MAG: hypothetical protein D6762_07300 [Candidatus Neomarinimicrobiota bacterium]
MISGLAYPLAVRPLKNWKFWVAIALLVGIVPLFSGVRDRSFLGIAYSSHMFAHTRLMAFRGVTVFMLFQVLTVDLNSESFARLLTRWGNPTFLTLFELSREIIPNARHILHQRWKEHPPLFSPRSMLRMIRTIFLDLIRLADRLDQPLRPRLAPDPESVIKTVSPPALIIVTGARSAGKSTWLKSLLDVLKQHSLSAGGLLTLRKPVTPENWTLQLMDVSNGEFREVATMTPRDSDLKTEHYYFDTDALEWGTERLTNARQDWIIVDEVGLFEFNRQGFFPALQILDGRYTGILVWSLRKSLVVELEDYLERNFLHLPHWPRYYIVLDRPNVPSASVSR